jgi:hypothetical protein
MGSVQMKTAIAGLSKGCSLKRNFFAPDYIAMTRGCHVVKSVHLQTFGFPHDPVWPDYSNAHPLRRLLDSSSSVCHPGGGIVGPILHFPYDPVRGRSADFPNLAVNISHSNDNELVKGSSQRRFSEQDQAVRAGFLDTPHESLGLGVEIWRAQSWFRRLHPAAASKVRNSAVNSGSRS